MREAEAVETLLSIGQASSPAASDQNSMDGVPPPTDLSNMSGDPQQPFSYLSLLSSPSLNQGIGMEEVEIPAPSSPIYHARPLQRESKLKQVGVCFYL